MCMRHYNYSHSLNLQYPVRWTQILNLNAINSNFFKPPIYFNRILYVPAFILVV